MRSHGDLHQRGCKYTCKLFAIDRFTARTVPFGKVAALEHESRNDTVESRSLVTKAVLARSELTEVFGCLWHLVVVELEYDAASGLIVDCDVELR